MAGDAKDEARAIAALFDDIEVQAGGLCSWGDVATAASEAERRIATALAAKDAKIDRLNNAFLPQATTQALLSLKIASEAAEEQRIRAERAEAGERAAHDAANTAIRQRDEARDTSSGRFTRHRIVGVHANRGRSSSRSHECRMGYRRALCLASQGRRSTGGSAMTWAGAFAIVGGAAVLFGGYVAMEISRHRALVRVAELAAEDERLKREAAR